MDGYFNGIHKELTAMAEMFPRIDKDVERHHFAFLLQQMLEEFNHYVLFADILEHLTGRKIDVDADPVQLSEEKKLQEMRRRYVTSGSAIDKSAVLFTEGGGAALFREGAKVKGGPLEVSVIWIGAGDLLQVQLKTIPFQLAARRNLNTRRQTLPITERKTAKLLAKGR